MHQKQLHRAPLVPGVRYNFLDKDVPRVFALLQVLHVFDWLHLLFGGSYNAVLQFLLPALPVALERAPNVLLLGVDDHPDLLVAVHHQTPQRIVHLAYGVQRDMRLRVLAHLEFFQEKLGRCL